MLPWLLTPHQELPNSARLYTDRLYNEKPKKGRLVVEHAFGILKQCFFELGLKSELEVTFLLDVIIVCCLMHNLLMAQSTEKVEQLLEVLQTEDLVLEMQNDCPSFDPTAHG